MADEKENNSEPTEQQPVEVEKVRRIRKQKSERELWLELIESGGTPELAYQLHPETSFEDFEEISKKDAFTSFFDAQLKIFTDSLDKQILGRLFMFNRAMGEVNPDHSQYFRILTRLSKEYREFLALSEPMLQRMIKTKAENFPVNLLELRIEGINDTPE